MFLKEREASKLLTCLFLCLFICLYVWLPKRGLYAHYPSHCGKKILSTLFFFRLPKSTCTILKQIVAVGDMKWQQHLQTAYLHHIMSHRVVQISSFVSVT